MLRTHTHGDTQQKYCITHEDFLNIGRIGVITLVVKQTPLLLHLLIIAQRRILPVECSLLLNIIKQHYFGELHLLFGKYSFILFIPLRTKAAFKLCLRLRDETLNHILHFATLGRRGALDFKLLVH